LNQKRNKTKLLALNNLIFYIILSAIVSDPVILNKLSSEWNSICKNAFLLFDKDNSKTVQKLWMQHFGSYGDSDKKNLSASNYQELTMLYTDRYFSKCTREGAILHARTNTPTYMYYLTYKGDVSIGHGLASSKGKYPVILEIVREWLKMNIYKFLGWQPIDYGEYSKNLSLIIS